MRIHCLQHVSFENPGTILEWISNNNHSISYTYFFEENPLIPELDSFDVLLVLGGYMNVNDEANFPWLKNEKTFIKQVVDAHKKIFGICLGSQLLADVLGGKVIKGTEKEIGFFPISFSEESRNHHLFSHFPKEIPVFHWHSDTFLLPEKATSIASSKAFTNQAFTVGNQILAFQFHIEMNETIIENLIQNEPEELNEKGSFIQTITIINNNYKNLNKIKNDFFQLLDKFFNNGI